jgi:MoaA/NifB/PqqE/SkfB family radical SAM enzyme
MTANIAPRITLSGRTKLETVIPLSTPYLVFLDPSDICNAKCPHCPTGSGEARKYRKPQLMDFELYKKIIDDLCTLPEPIKTLRLYMMGEPLLNPRFPDMVKYAKDTGRFGQIDTTTNGLLLTTDMSDELVMAGLDKIFISVPQNYNRNYIDNIDHLYWISRGHTEIHVKIIGDGMDEIDKDLFMTDFGSISGSIFIEHLSPCWPGFKVDGVNEEVGIYGQPIKKVTICPYIFYSLAINSDGTVSLCFLDWSKDMIIGDLQEESFKDIWNGPLLRNIRVDHIRGYRMKTTHNCEICGQLSYGAPDDLEPYAQDILRRL